MMIYIYYDEVCVCLSRKITTSHFRAERQRREVSRLLWPSDDDDDVDGEEHYIDMLRSSEIPSEAIVVDAARNCVTSLGRSKAQKAFSLSLGLSDAQTTGFTLSSGKITQMLSTKYFQPHERIFL